jgi:CGNR zinc finger
MRLRGSSNLRRPKESCQLGSRVGLSPQLRQCDLSLVAYARPKHVGPFPVLARLLSHWRLAGLRAGAGKDPLRCYRGTSGPRRRLRPDAASASDLLKPFLDGSVDARELPALRAVQRSVVAIVDALIDGSQPPFEALNALAAQEPAICALEPGPDRGFRATLRAKRASATASLLIALVGELGDLEPAHVRRCARSECGLVFYDLSCSATQRWRAERPCGLRERQRRHRAARAARPAATPR